jgi:hypothetical protein
MLFVIMTDVDSLFSQTGASELERGIARYRRLIINKWGNDYDNSIKYIHPGGMEIPCTPAMIKDWSHAMVSHHGDNFT